MSDDARKEVLWLSTRGIQDEAASREVRKKTRLRKSKQRRLWIDSDEDIIK